MRFIRKSGGGSLRARAISAFCLTTAGICYTLGDLGLLAPVAYSAKTGNANLSIPNASGQVTATAGVSAGASQSIAFTATGADGVALPVSLTLTGAPVAPAAPTLSLVPGSGQIIVSWVDGADGGAAISSHKLYRGTAPGAEVLVGTIMAGSPFIDTGLTNGTSYYYKLSAVNAVGEGSLSSEQSAQAGAVAPTFQTYTFAQAGGGWLGTKDTARTAGRTYAYGNDTIWAAYITGSEGYIYGKTDFSPSGSGAYEYSLDFGATWATPSALLGGGRQRLYTGLSDIKRLVFVRIVGATTSTTFFLSAAGDLHAEAYGSAPLVEPLANFRGIGSVQADALWATATKANYAGGNYTPALVSVGAQPNTTYGVNTSCVVYDTDATELLIQVRRGGRIYVSVDGGLPTLYTLGGQTVIGYKLLTGLSGRHKYSIWTRDNGSDNYIWVAGYKAGGATVYTPSTVARLDQFGDSITAGDNNGCIAGQGDIHMVAAYYGMAGGNFGLDSDTGGALDTRLPTILTNLSRGAGDKAILAIGHNDSAVASATRVTNYTNILTKLTAKGYGKVIVRGVLPINVAGTKTPATAINADLQTALAAVNATNGNTNCVYRDTDNWYPVDHGSDNVHPTPQGYIDLRAWAIDPTVGYSAIVSLP